MSVAESTLRNLPVLSPASPSLARPFLINVGALVPARSGCLVLRGPAAILLLGLSQFFLHLQHPSPIDVGVSELMAGNA